MLPDHHTNVQPVNSHRLLGFDYGVRKIGVATANTLTGTSQALLTLPFVAGKPHWKGLDSIVQQWQPDTLVVGLPLHLDGSESTLSQHCRKFAFTLQARYEIPAVMSDERLSSDQAALQLRQGQTRSTRHQQLRDAVAAELILHTYIQQL
ncbi:MAG TPA: Holliday junction resolvase RuvX [Gammaproteobacteria bacterium]|nr:Holliday junction resolvase RuvX [Gammaproteobacteria bacterium]